MINRGVEIIETEKVSFVYPGFNLVISQYFPMEKRLVNGFTDTICFGKFQRRQADVFSFFGIVIENFNRRIFYFVR